MTERPDPGPGTRAASRPAAGGDPVEIQCLSCGHRGLLEGTDPRLVQNGLVGVTRRLRCSACGSRAVKATRRREPRDIARRMRARMGRSADEPGDR